MLSVTFWAQFRSARARHWASPSDVWWDQDSWNLGSEGPWAPREGMNCPIPVLVLPKLLCGAASAFSALQGRSFSQTSCSPHDLRSPSYLSFCCHPEGQFGPFWEVPWAAAVTFPEVSPLGPPLPT